jgi:hypothetical protein
MAEEKSSNKTGVFGTLLAGAGAVLAFILAQASEEGGKMFGEWLGMKLLLPLVVIAGCCWLMTKLLRPEYKFLNLALGVPAGHFVILLAALMLMGRAAFSTVGFDLAVLAGGIGWFFARPGVWQLLLLIAYEILGLAMLFYALAIAGFDPDALQNVVSWILIRAFSLVFLYDGYRTLKAKSIGAGPSTPQTAV